METIVSQLEKQAADLWPNASKLLQFRQSAKPGRVYLIIANEKWIINIYSKLSEIDLAPFLDMLDSGLDEIFSSPPKQRTLPQYAEMLSKYPDICRWCSANKNASFIEIYLGGFPIMFLYYTGARDISLASFDQYLRCQYARYIERLAPFSHLPQPIAEEMNEYW